MKKKDKGLYDAFEDTRKLIRAELGKTLDVVSKAVAEAAEKRNKCSGCSGCSSCEHAEEIVIKKEVVCTMTDGHFSFSEIIPEEEVKDIPIKQLYDVAVSNDDLAELKDNFLFEWVEGISQYEQCPSFALENPNAMRFKLEVKIDLQSLPAPIQKRLKNVIVEKHICRWLATPNESIGGIPPWHLFESEEGRKELQNLLGRIEYGLFS